MKFKDKYNVAPEFSDLFLFKSKEEELEHEAKMIMFRFLSEIEKLNGEKPIKKKALAQLLNTSASYVTQLYQGDKLINLLTLAKLQEAFNITFSIKAIPTTQNYKEGIVAPFGKEILPSIARLEAELGETLLEVPVRKTTSKSAKTRLKKRKVIS